MSEHGQIGATASRNNDIRDTDFDEETSLYDGYEIWKGWGDRPFQFTAEDAEYYAGEFKGLRIHGANVFEIGFGSGAFLAWALANGATVSGSEKIGVLVEAGRQKGIEILHPDFERSADENAGRFDTIVAFDVLEHMTLNELRARFQAIAIMLRAGGAFVARFPNAQSPFGLVPQFGDPTHLSFLSVGIIERLVSGTPLMVERYSPAYRIYGSGSRRLVRICRYAVRFCIERLLSWTYAHDVPLAPVTVIVLRKSE